MTPNRIVAVLTPLVFAPAAGAIAAWAAKHAPGVSISQVDLTNVFIAGALASLALLRPIARAHLHVPTMLRTGTAALVGVKATVVQRVDAGGGRVRIGGDEWTARPFMEGQVFEPGVQVEVAEIKGATALVFE